MPRTARAKVRRHGAAVPSALSKKDSETTMDVELPAFAPPSPEASTSAFPPEPTEASSSKRPLSFKETLAQTAPHPYLTLSKSHLRREKRKARSQLAGGGLSALTSALGDIAPDDDDDDNDENEDELRSARVGKEKGIKEKVKKASVKEEKGKIGLGRGRTLGEKKRREVIQESAKRIPAVMNHPAYKQKPWATIREHVGNTLATK